MKWWYHCDHKHHYGWDNKWKKGENYIGATVHSIESLNEFSVVAAKIKFHHPSDFFSSEGVASVFEKNEYPQQIVYVSVLGRMRLTWMIRVIPLIAE
ncbi:hypothetical protein [Xenorhabdus szentirmaii]|uniref:hypothetical protein n=1 Tax=Xenorhabdus szentirmaii TaxID=290112 RepID=UPI0038CD6CD0